MEGSGFMGMSVQMNNIVGIVGYGKMGRSFALRLKRAGRNVVVFDPAPQAQKNAESDQIKRVNTLKELGCQSQIIFLLVPSGKIIDNVIRDLSRLVDKKAIIIDAGNSNFNDTIRYHQFLSEYEVSFLDCGTSGGVHGLKNGFCLMVGGRKEIYDSVEFLFKDLAAPNGYAYVGLAGAGHYVKMVHNGIEYAILQSYAEGFHLLKDGQYQDLDLSKIAHLWNHGSVIRSFILELLAESFDEIKDFSAISGKVAHTGMGQWTVIEAHKQDVPVKLIEESLKARLHSQENGGNFATKLVAILRNKFGGHAIEKYKSCDSNQDNT